MKKWFLSVATVLVLCSPMIADEGQSPMNNRIMGDDIEFSHVVGQWEKLEKRLELSDKQISELNRLNKQYKLMYLEKIEQVTPIRIKIKKELLEDDIRFDEIRKLMLEAAPIQIDMRLLMLRHKSAIRSVLTQDQRMKLEHMRHEKPRRGWF